MVVIGSLDTGGAEMHLLQVLPALVKRGFEVRVQTLSGRGALADRMEVAGVPVSVGQPGRRNARPSPVLRVFRVARAVWSLLSTLRRWRPDVVHFFLPESYLIGAPVALVASGSKRVMSRRSLADYQVKRPFVARIEHLLHRFMHALSGNAAAVVAQLAAEGAPPARLHLIRNGIDFSRFAGGLANPAQGGRPLTLLIVANLIPYKGHADLIDALASAAARLPDWVLLCAGRDDGIAADLAARAARCGIGHRVRFLGSRDDVPALMAQADLALLCSHEEGFPNAAIEAMAAGLPLVATRVGGVPEAVIEGETGLLVPSRDPAALAEAIVALGNDPARRAAMGKAARARAELHFGLDACTDAYAKMYRSL